VHRRVLGPCAIRLSAMADGLAMLVGRSIASPNGTVSSERCRARDGRPTWRALVIMVRMIVQNDLRVSPQAQEKVIHYSMGTLEICFQWQHQRASPVHCPAQNAMPMIDMQVETEKSATGLLQLDLEDFSQPNLHVKATVCTALWKETYRIHSQGH
jgi:hypothetical protein